MGALPDMYARCPRGQVRTYVLGNARINVLQMIYVTLLIYM